MRKIKIVQGRKCPRCGDETQQLDAGQTTAGSKRCKCKKCKKWYTPNPKRWAYTEDERKEAMKMLINRGTGRGIGKHFRMHHSNVLRWSREEAKKGTPRCG